MSTIDICKVPQIFLGLITSFAKNMSSWLNHNVKKKDQARCLSSGACVVATKQAFTNISKMQLMEHYATGALACNLVFPVIMDGECFLVMELGTDNFHVWNFICST